jgi:hypothetical protein
MKVDYLEKQLLPIGFLMQDSLSGVADWQLIFLQSKANGCSYSGEDLPHMKWQWPRDTWFQEQLGHHLKDLEIAAHDARN